MAKPSQKSEARAAQAVRHSFTFTDNEPGQSWEFPTLQGTMGPKVIDTRKLYSQTGVFTYDPGFASTASCTSDITYIDGDAGILLHRGYAIDDLAKNKYYTSEESKILFAGTQYCDKNFSGGAGEPVPEGCEEEFNNGYEF